MENDNAQKNASENILEIKDLKVSFFTPAGEVRAVDGATLSLARGGVLGLVGESGSGKSVLADAVTGLVERPGRVLGGSIAFNGRDVLKLGETERRRLRGREIGMIFQDPLACLDPVFTVGSQLKEAVGLYFGLHGRRAAEKAAELLRLAGVDDPWRRLRQYPHELSGGMRQRVMIATAIAGSPALLIADEPTTALDVTIQAQIIALIRELKTRSGLSVLWIAHDLGVVAGLADRVAVMYGGRVVEAATCGEIFSGPRHPYTIGLLGSMPRLDRAERLVPIEGSPAERLNPPAGCPFAARCGRCLKVCLKYEPPFLELSEGHGAACWLLDPRAGAGAAG